MEVIKKADKSAVKLRNILTTDFPCFRDCGLINGKEISFHKRAQIFVADLWSLFKGQSYGEFHDMDQLTMFADYRVP